MKPNPQYTDGWGQRCMLRRLEQTLYDSIDIYSDHYYKVLSYFSAPIGMPRPEDYVPKTLRETNMTQQGKLPMPLQMDVRGFQFSLIPKEDMNEDDMTIFYVEAAFRFLIGQRIWFERKLTDIPGIPVRDTSMSRKDHDTQIPLVFTTYKDKVIALKYNMVADHDTDEPLHLVSGESFAAEVRFEGDDYKPAVNWFTTVHIVGTMYVPL